MSKKSSKAADESRLSGESLDMRAWYGDFPDFDTDQTEIRRISHEIMMRSGKKVGVIFCTSTVADLDEDKSMSKIWNEPTK